MRRKNNPNTNAPTEYQTPVRTPTTAPTSRPPNSKSTTTSRRTQNQTPVTSLLSRSDSSRRKNTFSSSLGRQQSTLTQIDWVATRRHLDSEDDDLDNDRLDYIDAEPNTQHNGMRRTNTNTNINTSDVIEISDDSGNDADYQPAPSSQTRPARGVRFGQKPITKTDIPRRRKSSPKSNSVEKGSGRRKSGGSVRGSNKKDKQPKERDKTLTQMDYVRRYLKIEPDDDVKLEYTYYSPKKDRDPKSREAHRRSAQEAALLSTKLDGKGGIKRRRLTEELGSKDDSNFEETRPVGQLSGGLVTPKKTIKSEVPSSQSPESPGLVLVSPSQFRETNRFPLKQTSVGRLVKEEQSGSAERKAPHYLDRASPSPGQASLPDSPVPPISRNNIPSDDEGGPDTTPRIRPSNTQRTIVYETDAESDYGETQDELSVPPSSQKPKLVSVDDNSIEDIQDSQRYDSQELPSPVVPSGPDNETGPSYSDLSSDASICYRRPHHSTQLPLEPIPPMNTQALAELFPREKENSAQQIMTDTTQTQSSPAVQRHPLRTYPQLTQTQTQTQTQSQSNSQDLKTSTDIVLESSPVTRRESNPSMPQESVVQVESSQPADRFLRNAGIEQDSGPRGQLLSSSVLESIPMPPLWMGSQDSVGEPYSEPGNE